MTYSILILFIASLIIASTMSPLVMMPMGEDGEALSSLRERERERERENVYVKERKKITN